MKIKVQDLMIPSKDFLKMKAFYENVLQMDVVESDNDYVKLKDKSSGQFLVIANGPCVPSLTLACETTNAKEFQDQLEKFGGKRGDKGIFFDPEGNPLMVWESTK